MFTHPSPGHEKGTASQLLVAEFPEMARVGSVERPGVVHRLDAGTSGVMLFARTQRAYRKLREDFESHKTIEKKYLAVVHGAPKPPSGVLEAPIGRKPWDPKRMAIGATDGKYSKTRWQILSRKGGLSLVEFTIETGRMHQIRLVAAHLGSPIVGDGLYGDEAKDKRLRRPPRRLLLHSVSIAFNHPVTGKRMEISALPPSDIVYACL